MRAGKTEATKKHVFLLRKASWPTTNDLSKLLNILHKDSGNICILESMKEGKCLSPSGFRIDINSSSFSLVHTERH